ncbi:MULTISPECIES: alpha,alpha-phosphotrehalase [unclassified Luteococcus]|uniref:alpha,alpha-phosphotrehalase n=1 Tax=unclassified Luteococcus TaxID=2639923 RepID=UPI00313DF889
MSFHDAVVYQIYPKSFRDSDSDGIGDLRGILEKVDHIASLGVDLVWLNPFYPSPQRDNGYDVSDYCAVDPTMGTMEEFEELVAELGKHGIGVMLDMVLNHTSTAHEWFQQALAGDQKYRDYYLIRPPRDDGSLPTSWLSKFGGPAWAPFGDTGDYYLHLFDVSQADLNWRNPEVRREMAEVVNFWRGKGVKAFRFDVINLIGKAEQLVDGDPGGDGRDAYTDGPDVHPYLQELAAASFGQDPDSVTVGEMSSTSIQACVGYSNPDNHELSMVFNFHHLKVDYADGKKWTQMPFDLAELKRLLDEWATGMQEGNGWNALFWNNHDQPRAINRFGDPERYHAESATMLATAIHLLRGTPYVYMGEEIGMTDPDYTAMTDYVDVEAHHAFSELVQAGELPDRAFQIVHAKARDNARTPMQWDSSPTAGFSGVPGWLRPTNQDRFNVADEESSGRILPYYRELIALRKRDPLISEGRYESFNPGHPSVFGYQRSHEGRRLLVLTNFRGEDAQLQIPAEFAAGHQLIGNYPEKPIEEDLTLRPYEALAIVVEPS